MYAIIQTGSKQYKVTTNTVFKVEKINGETGKIINLNQVLMICNNDIIKIGNPFLQGVSIISEITDQIKNAVFWDNCIVDGLHS